MTTELYGPCPCPLCKRWSRVHNINVTDTGTTITLVCTCSQRQTVTYAELHKNATGAFLPDYESIYSVVRSFGRHNDYIDMLYVRLLLVLTYGWAYDVTLNDTEYVIELRRAPNNIRRFRSEPTREGLREMVRAVRMTAATQ